MMPTISAVVLTRNRLDALQKCIESLKQPEITEVIVIDNGSTDDTPSWLTSTLRKFTKYQTILLPHNEWEVVSRNFGFQIAKSELILQIDDDVVLQPRAIPQMLEYLTEDVIAVGQQGALVCLDWSNFTRQAGGIGSYVDVLTGFCWIFRNNQLWQYPWSFAPQFHEETELQLRMKLETGMRLRKCPIVCTHHSKRERTDWESHNRNLEYIQSKYRPLAEQGILRLET